MSSKTTLIAAMALTDKTAVTEVDASDATSLAELVQFPNLVSLSLSKNQKLRDLGPLAALPKLEKLWLDDMGLTEIPPEVARLERLRVLFLGKNTIKDFSLLRKMPELVDLGLENLGLKKIPDEVLALKNLRIVGLFGNSLATIAPLGKLEKLEEIYAAENQLKQVPDELRKLPRLAKLDIMHNYALTSWGPIESLGSLVDLSLSNAHKLPRLPAGIFSLEKLTKLTLAIHWNAPADPLEGLADIGKLASLESLHVSGASMTTLPAAFGTLHKLSSLDLADSKELADVGALAGLPALKELTLSKCEKLADIGGLRDLPALETLNLSQSALTAIPETFSTLKKLTTLDLSHSQNLRSFAGLAELPALNTLTLYCPASELPESLGTLTALTTLKLATKGAKVEFLAGLTKLEELYIAECSFDALPVLPNLKRLTIFRDRPTGDAYLASFPALEELKIVQSRLSLPAISSLRSLTVRKIKDPKDLDLTSLANMPALRELAIEVCDTLTTIPKAIATATGLEKLTFDMLDTAVDFDALAGSSVIDLTFDGCEKLTALPASLIELPRLRRLKVESCDELTDLSVLGKLGTLTVLELARLDAVTKLPSMDGARSLESVSLKRLRALKDVSGLANAPGLKSFVADDCSKLPAAAAAAIKNRLSGASAPPKLKTSYASFMKTKAYRSLVGKEDTKHTYPFPLSFGTPEELLETMEGFSWLDDHRDDGEGDLQSMLAGEESAVVPLAVLDFGFEGCEDVEVDSYSEEIFLVDTADERNPVLLWGHDGSPKKIHDSFDDFLANLRDFGAPKKAAPTPTGGGELASLTFVEGTSSKFWKIVLLGDSHTVTYGKLGTAGTSKTKSFPSAEAASKDANKLVAEKRGKGYKDG